MNKNLLLGALAVGLSLLLVFVLVAKKPSNNKESKDTSTKQVSSTKKEDEVKEESNMEKKADEEEMMYSLEEIAKHNTKEDCWFAVNGEVYDVTPFIASAKHPGGEAILQGCGKDATTLYETRPMGSGTPHSDKARESLKKFRIGKLK